jgi:hypothetical protein
MQDFELLRVFKQDSGWIVAGDDRVVSSSISILENGESPLDTIDMFK